MRLLGRGLAGIRVGLGRQIARAVGAFDVRAHRGHGLAREVGGVGSHVGDVAGLVQALRQCHSPAHPEPESRRRGLLQRRGDERRPGAGVGRLVLPARHAEAAFAQARLRCRGLLRGARAEVLALRFDDLETVSRLRGIPGPRQVGERLPILLRHEGADSALALHDQAHGDGLHAARGQPAGDLGPQERRQFEAHHPVEKAARLLGVDAVFVDLAGILERGTNGVARDLVEHHAPEAARRAADEFLQVPGNGLALAVAVGRQIDGVRAACQLLQVGDDLLLAGQHLVVRPPSLGGVDAHARDQLRAGTLAALRLARLGRQLLARRSPLTCSRFRLAPGLAADR